MRSPPLRAIGVPEDNIGDVLIAVGEVVGNVIRHGGGAGEIRLTRSGRRLKCDIADRGPGLGDGPYEPPKAAGPEADHGRGLWLVFALCTVVELDSSPHGTRVSLGSTCRTTSCTAASELSSIGRSRLWRRAFVRPSDLWSIR